MTNTIDLNIMMPPLHHTMFISDTFVLLSQGSVWLLTLTRLGAIHEHGILTFLRHFSWDIKLQTGEIKELLASLHRQVTLWKANKQEKKMKSNTVKKISFQSHLLSPRSESTHSCHTSHSVWAPAHFATKMLAMEKEVEFIPIHYRLRASHVLPLSLHKD